MSASVPIEGRQPVLPDEPGGNERLQALPSWAISLVVHSLLLLMLWPIQIATSMIRDSIVTASMADDELANPLQAESFRFDTAVSDEVGNKGDSTGPGDRVAPLGSAISTPRAPAINVVGTVAVLGSKSMAIKRPMLDIGAATPDRELSDLIETTGSSEHAGGVRGAVDRLTIEIEASVRQENTLVVWLFDASLSLKSRRETIADRFENIYRQLGILGVGSNGALKTVVATFGQTTEYLTPKPVDDVGAVQKAIRKIKDDDEGIENVFGAVLNAATKYRVYRTGKKDRRRVMMIVVTDERGDDYGKLEEAIGRLRKLGMRVYCVGDDAVFGREHRMIPWTYDDGFREEIPVDQGPETVRLEHLQLAFWGRDPRFLREFSSSFGPYALCRLCAETGGLYLISEEIPGPKFDPGIMRNYLPDYRSIADYETERARNAAKAGLVGAAEVTKTDEIPNPTLTFRADNENTLRQQITEAQKPLAVLDYRLNEMESLLESGEKDRPDLDTPRWKASYDLAMGRVLAMRARALGYNVMLAEMKTSPRPFQNAADNTWRIVPASEAQAPAKIQKLAKRARIYLNGIIEQHRGTPWELLAREELREPLGWEWQEFHVDYPPPPPPRQPPNPIQLEEERQRSMMPRQPQEPRVRPKL